MKSWILVDAHGGVLLMSPPYWSGSGTVKKKRHTDEESFDTDAARARGLCVRSLRRREGGQVGDIAAISTAFSLKGAAHILSLLIALLIKSADGQFSIRSTTEPIRKKGFYHRRHIPRYFSGTALKSEQEKRLSAPSYSQMSAGVQLCVPVVAFHTQDVLSIVRELQLAEPFRRDTDHVWGRARMMRTN
ncbi:hypothetical protein EYF80_020908 [Liparis tanakae]|uniref:Uncharacterized protein n=1 Tax=Liparis tanakae TaxID=230148 RepID=A0A4Z2HV79_9TELE|nr:hypothetical protein EYF80_020908 [Liparis tanakae]